MSIFVSTAAIALEWPSPAVQAMSSIAPSMSGDSEKSASVLAIAWASSIGLAAVWFISEEMALT